MCGTRYYPVRSGAVRYKVLVIAVLCIYKRKRGAKWRKVTKIWYKEIKKSKMRES